MTPVVPISQVLNMGSPPLGVWEMCARGLVAFVYGTVVVRLFGRRIFARWSALDVVIAVSMGSTLSRAITGPVAFWPAIAATTLMLLVHRALSMAAARSGKVARFVEGGPVVVARDGVLDDAAAFLQGVSAADINEALRLHGLEESTRRDG